MICIFPNGENIHLIKDVGMVPFMLYKEGYYDSTIAFYEDEKNLPYLRTEVQGLRYKKISKIFDNEALNIFYFLLRNIAQYDVVMFFHGGHRKLLISIFFKLLSMGKVKFYYKLDVDERILNDYKLLSQDSIKYKLFKLLYSQITLLTVETKLLTDFFNKNTYLNVKYLPNGFIKKNNQVEILDKKNIFLTVGRIGSEQKDNITLLKALEQVKLKDWEVVIIGNIEKSFVKVINDFFGKNPNLINNVKFLGQISDRNELADWYKKSKIFILTSKYESFGLVTVEALSEGCYILSTDLAASRDMTNNGQFGTLFSIGDDLQLAKAMQEVIDGKALPDANDIKSYAEEFYNWKLIARNIHSCLEFKN